MRMKLSEQIGFFDQAEYHFRREVDTDQNRKSEACTYQDQQYHHRRALPMINVAANLWPSGGAATPTYVRCLRTGGEDRFRGENQVRLSDATFSSCKPGKPTGISKVGNSASITTRTRARPAMPQWSSRRRRSSTAQLDRLLSTNQRKSGFLMGSFAASSKNGVDVTFALLRQSRSHYDVTLYPRHMSNGEPTGVEARYSTTTAQRCEGRGPAGRPDGWPGAPCLQICSTQFPGQGLHLNLNLNGVSDDSLLAGCVFSLLHTSQQQLPRQAVLTYAPGSWWSGSVRVLRYQTLNPGPKRDCRPAVFS